MNNSRALLIAVAVFIFFIVLISRLFDIQVIREEEFRYYAQRQQTSTEKIRAQRGMIYDRNNLLLAYNRNDVSFYVDLRMAKKNDREKIADKLSKVFGKTRQNYLNLMKASAKTICLEKKATGDKALLLRNFKADGFFSYEDPTRVYHYGTLASHILGFVGDNYEGVTGIEKNADAFLKGENGVMVIEKNAIGDLVTVEESETRAAVPGLNICLTIDKSFQSFLEEELKAGVKEFKASSASGIIMDPNTGEVLALANIEDYDPNYYWKYPDSIRRNRALTDTYEPGSTFKGISLAVLLDQKKCREDELLFVENGKYKFKRTPITDTHEHDWLTVSGVFEQSSNIGMAKLIQRIDNDVYFKYLRGFGLGNVTALDLPGEVKGKLKKPSEWSGLTKTFSSFGYEISVTPIQLITAYSALINGGVLYEPHIIKRKTDIGQNIVLENSPTRIRRVISENTSARMRALLAAVVERGTGKNAKLDFISSGGKTGTSQQLKDGSYSKAHYNSSFIGFFPAEDPKVICLILVNSPEKGRYGSLVAAPIFKRVAEKIYSANPDAFRNESTPASKYTEELKTASGSVPGGSKELIKISDIADNDRMPDLRNYSLKEAVLVLTKLGVKYKVAGSGRVTEQSIEPGSRIEKSMVCRISCNEITELKLSE